MIHPDCDHICTSNCRRVGCNCLCGEFHDSLDEAELAEILTEEQEADLVDLANKAIKENEDLVSLDEKPINNITN